ncbi:hypothetical protein [Kitasatospora sp. NPDC098663]|uniref:hypothetical protein n=1 Tax=Kitasatospora sp. NPDC098663 TaxID=3364096 RepID=UPI00381F6A2A
MSSRPEENAEDDGQAVAGLPALPEAADESEELAALVPAESDSMRLLRERTRELQHRHATWHWIFE